MSAFMRGTSSEPPHQTNRYNSLCTDISLQFVQSLIFGLKSDKNMGQLK